MKSAGGKERGGGRPPTRLQRSGHDVARAVATDVAKTLLLLFSITAIIVSGMLIRKHRHEK